MLPQEKHILEKGYKNNESYFEMNIAKESFVNLFLHLCFCDVASTDFN